MSPENLKKDAWAAVAPLRPEQLALSHADHRKSELAPDKSKAAARPADKVPASELLRHRHGGCICA